MTSTASASGRIFSIANPWNGTPGIRITESTIRNIRNYLKLFFRILSGKLENGFFNFHNFLLSKLILPFFSLGLAFFVSHDADHPLFLLLADIAAQHDVPIDIHFDVVTKDMLSPHWLTSPNNPKVLRANLDAFERLLDHNPKAKLCWDHAGSDNTSHWTVDLSRRLLQKHQNLYMSLRVGPGNSRENFPMTREGQIKPE